MKGLKKAMVRDFIHFRLVLPSLEMPVHSLIPPFL